MDVKLRLAYSLHKNPGAFVLLLGSGISKSSGVPTGWEITHNLIQQLNSVSMIDLSEEMDYSVLLEKLGKTESERNAIIRQFFEPKITGDESEETITPSSAHRAIAQLIKLGYFKVILTTNFDRLLERALEEIGITPDVIRSDEMLVGTSPHVRILIYKLHGDYRDIQSLNTKSELESYSEEKNFFLDSILSRHGLIVCGWSATWDKALRDAVYRTNQRWYSNYWIEPGQISVEGNELIRHRNAEVIQSTADEFFGDLLNTVSALAKLDSQDPLTVSVAVERVKKLILATEKQVELEDLLRTESAKAYATSSKLQHVPGIIPKNIEGWVSFYEAKSEQYLSASEVMLNMILNLVWFGSDQQLQTLKDIIRQWGTSTSKEEEHSYIWRIRPLLLMYIIGITAVHREKGLYLRMILREASVPRYQQKYDEPAHKCFRKTSVFASLDILKTGLLLNDPVSQMLKELLYPMFKFLIPYRLDFDRSFDIFEMIWAAILAGENEPLMGHDPIGRAYAMDQGYDYMMQFWTDAWKKQPVVREVFANKEFLTQALTSYTDLWKGYSTKIKLPDYVSVIDGWTRDYLYKSD